MSAPLIPVKMAAHVLASTYLRDPRVPESSGDHDLLLTAAHKTLHDVADAGYKPLLVAVRYAFARGRAAVHASGSLSKRFAAVPKVVRESLEDVLPTTLAKIAARGANHAVSRVKTLKTAAETSVHKPPFTLTFNDADPRAVEWAKQHAATLAKDIADTTQQAIADAIARAIDSGDVDSAYDDVFNAIGDDARAEMITRTEIMTAANEGQRLGWDAAVDDGLLSERATRVWIATDDACDDCKDLDGEEATLDGEYPDDGGDGPPLHPNCRCTEGING